MGDPGARLLTSPLPQPTLPTSCFSSFSPNLDYHPQVKKKKSDHTRSGQLLGSAPCPRPRLPRARAASLLPPHRSYRDDGQSCAGGLTAEATGPRRPQRRRGRALLHPRHCEKPALPGLKPPGSTPVPGKQLHCRRSEKWGHPGKTRRQDWGKPPDTQTSPRAFSSNLHVTQGEEDPGLPDLGPSPGSGGLSHL